MALVRIRGRPPWEKPFASGGGLPWRGGVPSKAVHVIGTVSAGRAQPLTQAQGPRHALPRALDFDVAPTQCAALPYAPPPRRSGRREPPRAPGSGAFSARRRAMRERGHAGEALPKPMVTTPVEP